MAISDIEALITMRYLFGDVSARQRLPAKHNITNARTVSFTASTTRRFVCALMPLLFMIAL